jgi:hypothetical protein
VGCLFGIMYISGFGAPGGVGLHMWEDGSVGWFVYSCEGGLWWTCWDCVFFWGGCKYVLCEGPRPSPCVYRMLIDAIKRYSQMLSFIYMGWNPFPHTLSWHYVNVVGGRWREFDRVWWLQDILSCCGWTYNMRVFNWVSICRVSFPRSGIMLYLVEWAYNGL